MSGHPSGPAPGRAAPCTSTSTSATTGTPASAVAAAKVGTGKTLNWPAIMAARREISGRSLVIKTAGERDRALAYGRILVAAGCRPVTTGRRYDDGAR